jgi:hypothetical protein
MMTRGIADIFEIIVLAPGPDTPLTGHGTTVIPAFVTKEGILELDHAGVGKQQGGVVPGNQRARGYTLVAALAEELEKGSADLRTGHFFHQIRFLNNIYKIRLQPCHLPKDLPHSTIMHSPRGDSRSWLSRAGLELFSIADCHTNAYLLCREPALDEIAGPLFPLPEIASRITGVLLPPYLVHHDLPVTRPSVKHFVNKTSINPAFAQFRGNSHRAKAFCSPSLDVLLRETDRVQQSRRLELLQHRIDVCTGEIPASEFSPQLVATVLTARQ